MEQRLMEYWVNSLWQAPLLACGAWLVLRGGKPGPRVQHGVWVAALVLMVAMPLLSLRGVQVPRPLVPVSAPAVVAWQGPAPLAETDSVAPLVSEDFAGATDQRPIPNSGGFPSVGQVPAVANERGRWLWMREMRLGPLATRWLLGIYLAAIGFAMMRLLWSWIAARRMVAEARPAVLNERELALLETCCEQLQVRRPRVLVSARTTGPLVVGVLRPALLLPEQFAAHSEEAWGETAREVEAVWLHELAHVRRRDYLANLVCRAWALPVAYHPATIAVGRRIRQTREMVCDHMAAEEMQSPVKYARCLVDLAQRMQDGCAGAEQMQGVGLFDGGILEERVVELIGKRAVESLRMRMVRAGCGAAMLAAVMGTAATFHVTPTMAQAAESTIAPARAMARIPLDESAPLPEVAELSPREHTLSARVQTAGSGLPVSADAAQVRAESQTHGAVQAAAGAIQNTPQRNGDTYKAWLDQDVVWIITPAERDAFLRLSNDGERDRFIEDFWLRRNPKPGFAENSYKAEHYKRITYANEHFAAGTPGWKTDRGRTYIVYGKPDSVDVVPTGATGEAGHREEVWHYSSLPGTGREAKMKFIDGCDCGEYRLQAFEGAPGQRLYINKLPGGTVVAAAGSDSLPTPNLPNASIQIFSVAPITPFPSTPAFAPLRFKILPETSLQPMTTGKWEGPGEFSELTQEQRLLLQKLNNPEFKKRLEETQRRAKEAMERMNTPEFKQKLAEAQKQAANLNLSELQKQLAEMRVARLKQQLDEAQRDLDKLNSSEGKK